MAAADRASATKPWGQVGRLHQRLVTMGAEPWTGRMPRAALAVRLALAIRAQEATLRGRPAPAVRLVLVATASAARR